MKLAEVLDEIRTGDVLLFRGRSLFAWLVKLRTRSVYSHAGVVIRVKANGTTRVCVLEALEPYGVRLYPLDVYVAEDERVDWFALTDETINREAIASFCLRQWGKRYALQSLWWSFSRIAWVVRKLFRSKLTPDPNRWFCSELVAGALRYAGFRADEDLVPIETDPGKVALLTCLQRKGALTL